MKFKFTGHVKMINFATDTVVYENINASFMESRRMLGGNIFLMCERKQFFFIGISEIKLFQHSITPPPSPPTDQMVCPQGKGCWFVGDKTFKFQNFVKMLSDVI